MQHPLLQSLRHLLQGRIKAGRPAAGTSRVFLLTMDMGASMDDDDVASNVK
jgi:hypothetical protein